MFVTVRDCMVMYSVTRCGKVVSVLQPRMLPKPAMTAQVQSLTCHEVTQHGEGIQGAEPGNVGTSEISPNTGYVQARSPKFEHTECGSDVGDKLLM